jgi:GntR family galactonate operon transcriptional repressor
MPKPNRHNEHQPLRRRSLPEMVVDQLGQRIVRGDFAGQSGLPTEAALSSEFGISRNALREAIKVLASKGLLEVRPKTGTRIRGREDWNVLDPEVVSWFSKDGRDLHNAYDFVEFRRIIEPQASYLAALRATSADIARINKTLENLYACIGHPAKVPVADTAFHRSIYDASHNAVLKHLGSLVTPLMHGQVQITITPAGAFEKGLPLHRKVAEAIARRDPKKAEHYARKLVNEPYSNLHAWIHPKDRGLLP